MGNDEYLVGCNSYALDIYIYNETWNIAYVIGIKAY